MLHNPVDELSSDINEFIELRRKIHSHPELGFEEKSTSELVVKKLKEWGYPPDPVA